MKVAFLTCSDLLPDAPIRRADAFEHDLQVAALSAALAITGGRVEAIDWRSPVEAFDGFDLLLLGTAWDYQTCPDVFLARLDELAARGARIQNPPCAVRWNIDKLYLRSLELSGAPIIPTIWCDDLATGDIAAAFHAFDCERVVVKRRVGAGAVGQCDFTRNGPPQSNWRFGTPGLIQPFVSSIATEGEYSVIFIDSEYSHALLKRPAPGDYRVQSLYGGVETAVDLCANDMRDARRIMDALPFRDLLYARIDMARGPEGRLLLMEAELIEPYLYPVQGPGLGARLARAIRKTLR
ncbi:MAG: RimK family alpha-L-glutamate ligase [Beijerinckiaceae bacterium]